MRGWMVAFEARPQLRIE